MTNQRDKYTKNRAYEKLREPEENLREEICQKMIDQLSEVRFLVSQVVMEEEVDDEVQQTGTTQFRNSHRNSQRNTEENEMYVNQNFMRILSSCRDICLQYLKTFDDMDYWKNIVKKSNKLAKTCKTERGSETQQRNQSEDTIRGIQATLHKKKNSMTLLNLHPRETSFQ